MIEKYFKIILSLALCIITPLKAEEVSRKRQWLAAEREARWQQKAAASKKNFPTADNPIPLAVREAIAKDRGITVEELDKGSVNRNQKELKNVVEKGISFISLFFLIIVALLLMQIRKSLKKRTNNKHN